MSSIDLKFRNAIVGILLYVNNDGIALVECDEVFQVIVVPVRIINGDDAQQLVGSSVCVFDSTIMRVTPASHDA